MPRSPRRAPLPALSRLCGLALAVALAPGAHPAHATDAAAAPPADVAADVGPLVGTWELVAADDLHPDGSRTRAYGETPRGVLMVDATGQYSLQIYRADRPRFAANDKRRGTPQEFESAVLGMSSHIGHCTLDPARGLIVFRIDAASFPNWDGAAQERAYTLRDGVLEYRIPASAGSAGGNVPISVWRKVR